MNKKVLIIANVCGFFETFEQRNIRLLKKLGYEVHCAANFKNDRHKLDDLHIVKHHIEIERSPFKLNNYFAYRELKEVMEEEKFDLVHCHTPMGGFLGRVVAKQTQTHPVIYTAHGFHFFKGAPLINWLLYYPIEKICSRFTDVIITINSEDYNRAKRKMHSKRVEYIPGVGIDVEKIRSIRINRTEKRKELGLTDQDIMLFSVGELNKNKNHEVIIRAMAEIKDPQIQYFIAGLGPLKDSLIDLSKKLNVEKQVHLLGYRDDIIELDKCADVFCFPSKREGLSVALMEAMACGVPIICSRIRGNIDLIKENSISMLCCYKRVSEFKKAIKNACQNISIEINVDDECVNNRVLLCDFNEIITKMEEIYLYKFKE